MRRHTSCRRRRVAAADDHREWQDSAGRNEERLPHRHHHEGTLETVPTARVAVTDFIQTFHGAAAGSPGSYNEQIQIIGSNSGEIT
jgi:hypothetical protein